MSRRSDAASEAAASAASEAARTLQARQQAVRMEKAEPASEPSPDPEQTVERTDPARVEKLLKARPHVQAMDEIAEKRGLVDKEDEPKDEPKAEEPKPDVKAEEQPAVDAAEAKTVKVKVDGEEFDVPEAEVTEAGGLKSYQMQRASENRLKKATEAANQARAAQEQTAKLLQAYAATQQAKPEAPKVSDQEFIATKLDAVRFGTPHESATALQEVIQRLTPKAIDQQAVIAQATNQMRHDQAVAQFDSEFADVGKNPMALKLVVTLRGERMAQLDKGAQVDWNSFYRTIGTDVRNAFGLRPSQPTKPTDTTAGTTSQPSEKEARKASIVNLPTASARAALPKEEKELTPEEDRKASIAAMKKARGQG